LRVFMTGGSGVLGRAARPLLASAGHMVTAPGSRDLDLFAPAAVSAAVAGADAVMHLATRIPPRARASAPGAWAENDRLRTAATRILVDAALASTCAVFVVPTVTFVYPGGAGQVDEDTPVGEVPPHLRSALDAESQAERFTAAGRRGVVLRLGLLWGPGTGSDEPSPVYGATLHIASAGTALAAALTAAPGIYNVTDRGGPVSSARFTAATGWQPGH
jgi:nucleoside-diphosphate-sugar epimerase